MSSDHWGLRLAAIAISGTVSVATSPRAFQVSASMARSNCACEYRNTS